MGFPSQMKFILCWMQSPMQVLVVDSLLQCNRVCVSPLTDQRIDAQAEGAGSYHGWVPPFF